MPQERAVGHNRRQEGIEEVHHAIAELLRAGVSPDGEAPTGEIGGQGVLAVLLDVEAEEVDGWDASRNAGSRARHHPDQDSRQPQ